MASPLTWYFPVILVPVIFGYCKMLLLCVFVCVCHHICRYVCAQVRHISVFFFSSFDELEKMSYCPFYCCRLCNPPDPAELSIVSPADRALGHISVWPWWRWFQDRWMPFALFVDTVEITWTSIFIPTVMQADFWPALQPVVTLHFREIATSQAKAFIRNILLINQTLSNFPC